MTSTTSSSLPVLQFPWDCANEANTASNQPAVHLNTQEMLRMLNESDDMHDVDESPSPQPCTTSNRKRRHIQALYQPETSHPPLCPISYETIYQTLPRYQKFRHILNQTLTSFSQQLFFSLRILQGKELLIDLYKNHRESTVSRTSSQRMKATSQQQLENSQHSGTRSSLNANETLWVSNMKNIELSTEDQDSHHVNNRPESIFTDTTSDTQDNELELGTKAIHAVYRDWKLLTQNSAPAHIELLKRSLFEMIQTAQKHTDRLKWNDLCITNQFNNIADEKCNLESLSDREKAAMDDLRCCKNIRLPLQLHWPTAMMDSSQSQTIYTTTESQLTNDSQRNSNTSEWNNHNAERDRSNSFDFASIECLQSVELSTLCLWLGWIYVLREEKDQGLCWLDTAVRIIENTNTSLHNENYMFEYYSRARLWKQDDLIIREYTKAIELRPRCPLPYNNLAISYTKTNRPVLALRCYNKSIEFDDKYTLSYNNRASLWANAFSSFDNAEQDYKTAIEIGDDLCLSYLNRANFFRTFRKDNIRSILDFTRCLELHPEDKDSLYCDRADTYMCLNDYQNALQDYNNCLRINPTHIVALYNRGMLYAGALNQPLQAIRDYTKCIECAVEQNAAPRTISGALNNRGIVHQEQDDWSLALKDFETALKVFRQCTHARSNLANLRALINDRWARGNQ